MITKPLMAHYARCRHATPQTAAARIMYAELPAVTDDVHYYTSNGLEYRDQG